MSPIITTNNRSTSASVWVILRVAVGVILIWKGIHFIRDTFILELLTGQHIENQFTRIEAVLLVMAVLVMVIGSLLMMAGVFTAFVSVVVLPLFLIGSLFIHTGHIERNGFELLLTSLVPFLLLLFIAKDTHQVLGDA